MGFIFAVVLGSLSVLTSCCSPELSDALGKQAFTSITHAGLGLLSFGYATANVITLGILGFIIEKPYKAEAWKTQGFV